MFNVIFATAISDRMAHNGLTMGIIITVWPTTCYITFIILFLIHISLCNDVLMYI
jgi:hypothetical protein